MFVLLIIFPVIIPGRYKMWGNVKFCCTDQRQRDAAAVVLDSAKITRKLSSRIVAVCWLCRGELSTIFRFQNGPSP